MWKCREHGGAARACRPGPRLGGRGTHTAFDATYLRAPDLIRGPGQLGDCRAKRLRTVHWCPEFTLTAGAPHYRHFPVIAGLDPAISKRLIWKVILVFSPVFGHVDGDPRVKPEDDGGYVAWRTIEERSAFEIKGFARTQSKNPEHQWRTVRNGGAGYSRGPISFSG